MERLLKNGKGILHISENVKQKGAVHLPQKRQTAHFLLPTTPTSKLYYFFVS